AARDPPRAGALGPDRGQMAFAATCRADEGQRAIGPIRPALDHVERCSIGGSGQEILARKAFAVRKRKRQLAGTLPSGHEINATPRAGLGRCREAARAARYRADLRGIVASQSARARRLPPQAALPRAALRSRTDTRTQTAQR